MIPVTGAASVIGPKDFIQTNIVGSFDLLEAVRADWSGLEGKAKYISVSFISPPTKFTVPGPMVQHASLCREYCVKNKKPIAGKPKLAAKDAVASVLLQVCIFD